jgi:hypothetical protein
MAKHHLKRLIREELEPEHQAALGPLLEVAGRGTHPPRLASILTGRSPAPLRCGRWSEEIELKPDALRPADWIMHRNPDPVPPADFRGDIRDAVLASLHLPTIFAWAWISRVITVSSARGFLDTRNARGERLE